MNAEIIIGLCFAMLQGITLYYVSRIDGRMDSHSKRLLQIQINCAGNHGTKYED